MKPPLFLCPCVCVCVFLFFLSVSVLPSASSHSRLLYSPDSPQTLGGAHAYTQHHFIPSMNELKEAFVHIH